MWIYTYFTATALFVQAHTGEVLAVNMHYLTYHKWKMGLWVHSFYNVQPNANDNLCNMPINNYSLFLTHHYEKSFVLINGGTAAKDSCEHDNSSCCDQDVGSKWICTGRQQTNVGTLIQESPESHCHHSTPRQLGEKKRFKADRKFIAHCS